MSRTADPARTAATAGAYLAVAAAVTFPLIARLTTHFPSAPGDADVFGFIWNNWWISYAIVELHRSPFATDYIWAPFDVDLRLHTFGFLYGLVSIPLTEVAGPVTALNVQALGTIALNGWSTFALARRVTADYRASFAAGLLIAAMPAVNFHIVAGRVSCAAVWPAVLAMNVLLAMIDRPRTSSAVALAATMWAMLLVDQQIALFGALWLCVLFVGVASFRWRDLLSRPFAAALALALVLTLPAVYWLHLDPFIGTADYTVPGAVEAANYSYPLSLLWTPSMMWRVYGTGLIVGLLAAGAVAARVRSVVPWIVGAVFFIGASIGPGEMGGVPSPFSMLRHLPGLAQFRTPYRFQIPAAIGCALCVAISLAWLRSSRFRSRLPMIYAALAIVSAIDAVVYRSLYGFPMQTEAHDPVYESLTVEHDSRLLLEVPLGVRTGTDIVGPGETLTFHQPVHRRRIINGMVARGPLAALSYYRSSPALMFLADEVPPPGDIDADLLRRLQELSVGHVIVHLDRLSDHRRREVLELLSRTPVLEQISASTDIAVFRRRAP